jgi:hypothetical protein
MQPPEKQEHAAREAGERPVLHELPDLLIAKPLLVSG